MKNLIIPLILLSFLSRCKDKNSLVVGEWVIETHDIPNVKNFFGSNLLSIRIDNTCSFPSLIAKRELGEWSFVTDEEDIRILVSGLSDIYNGEYYIYFNENDRKMILQSAKFGFRIQCRRVF